MRTALNLIASFLPLVYIVWGLFQFAAIYSYFTEVVEWNGLISVFLALLVAYVPLVGAIFGIIGATEAWDWSLAGAILLYFGHVFAALLYISGAAVWESFKSKSQQVAPKQEAIKPSTETVAERSPVEKDVWDGTSRIIAGIIVVSVIALVLIGIASNQSNTGYSTYSSPYSQDTVSYANDPYVATDDFGEYDVSEDLEDPEILFSEGLEAYEKMNYGVAFEKFEQSAALGYDEAAFQLASLYAKGEGTKSDYAKAVQTLKPLAEKGYIKAKLGMGLLYTVGGNGLISDRPRAFKLIKDAAESGDYESMYYLGLMYKNGVGTLADNTLARHWLKKAADKGNMEAMSELISLETIPPQRTRQLVPNVDLSKPFPLPKSEPTLMPAVHSVPTPPRKQEPPTPANPKTTATPKAENEIPDYLKKYVD